MDAPIQGVYVIRNTITDEPEDCYIGSAVNVKRRWARHRSELKLGLHPNQVLQRAVKKYGLDAFAFAVVELVAEAAQLTTVEQRYLDEVQPRYNIRRRAESNLGWKPSALTLARRSIGLKRAWQDPAHQENLRRSVLAGAAAVRGKPLSEAHRKLVGERTRLALADPAIRAKIAEASRQRIYTDEMRKNQGNASRLRWSDPLYRAKFRASRKEIRPGDKGILDQARRDAISAAKLAKETKRPDLTARNADPAYQAKIRAGVEAYWERKRAEKQNSP